MNEVLLRSPSVSWDREPATLAVLALLLGNYRCARMLRESPWKFAVRTIDLRPAGLTRTLGRRLLDANFIEYRPDPPPELGRGESERESRGYLVLTQAGAQLARERILALHDEEGMAEPTRPRWDGLVRELTFQRRLVKRFRRAAPNQESILTAFEGMGWPERIDDPLPCEQGVPAVVRLRETIKSLNQGQGQRLLRFQVESSGRAIRWRLAE